MGQIKIVTDSTADLSLEQVQRYGIKVMPITVTFGSDSYADGVDLNADQFYKKLTSEKVLPKTSQPSPEAFRQAYDEIGAEGDSIFSIHISGKLSGTLNSAELASKIAKAEVIPIDTKTASQGIGRTVLIAAEAVKRGYKKEEIIALINKSIPNTFSVFAVDTLEYLQRNGRIGKAASLLGSLLQLRPILYADPEGMVAPYDKVRGRSQIIPSLVAAALKNRAPEMPINLSVVHSWNREGADELLSELKKHYEIADLHIGMVGPAIGAHIGPGAVGLMIQPSFESLLKI
ncbi:MAG: DegV family protein [Firmicutes bacterium]|nr:DegV family protein [Bacillota bacterium]